MIAVDTNILVAFQRTENPHHERAVEAMLFLIEGREAWALPWHCIHEFVSVVTNPRIFSKPDSVRNAANTISAMLESPRVQLLSESPTYWDVFVSLAEESRVVGAQIHDARIAATCLDHGVRELWTADRDFSRFAGLKCRNPLVGAFPPNSRA